MYLQGARRGARKVRATRQLSLTASLRARALLARCREGCGWEDDWGGREGLDCCLAWSHTRRAQVGWAWGSKRARWPNLKMNAMDWRMPAWG